MSPAACHRRLDAAMQLLLAAGKPDATTVAQAGRFLNLCQPEQLGVEASRRRLPPGCNRDLHMVQAGDRHAPSVIRTAP